MDIQGGIVIRDEKGTPRIVLSADSRLSTISLTADNGAEILLEADQRCVRIRLRRAGSVPVAVVGAGEEGVGVWARLFDQRGVDRVSVAYEPDRGGETRSAMPGSR
jgi:hypothetical protein